MEKKKRNKRPKAEQPDREKRDARDTRDTFDIAGMCVDAKAARQAIILSEIIGPPAAKKRGRR